MTDDEPVAREGGGVVRLDQQAGADWAVIQLAYQESAATLPELAAQFGVTKGAISWRARRHGWIMRHRTSGSSGPSLVARIYRLLERQLFQMEKAAGPMSDKDAAILMRVATTVDRLMEVDERTAGKSPRRTAKETSEMQDMRKTIARRLEQLGDF